MRQGKGCPGQRGAVLPMLRGHNIVVVDGGPPEGTHIEIAHKAKQDNGQRHGIKRQGLRAPGGQRGSQPAGKGASQHRPPVSIDRADNGHIVQGWHCLSG